MEDEHYALYLHQCFGDAVRQLQEDTNTPEKLLKMELELGRIENQVSEHTAEINLGQARAGHKYDFVRYKG